MGFMTGKDIYENFTNGIGAEGLSGGAAMVNEVAAGYGDRAEAIRRITARMEAAWQGEAAGAARRGAGPLGVEHELAGVDLATAQDLTNRQAGSFADARNTVVPVPPEPTAPDPWAVFTSPVEVASHRQQVADYNAANQHNVDVMTGYANASSYNTRGMPQSYGALSDDQAGIVIDSGASDPGGGPRDGTRGAVEWADRGSGWAAPPSDAGGPAISGGPAPQDGGPQVTAPGGFTPAPGGPATPVPVGTGGGVGAGPPSGGPGSGLAPGTGLVPVGGGPAGRGADGRVPGGRGGGEPHGSGGRPGAGPLAGGASGEAHAATGRGGSAGRGGAMGGMPIGAGGRGRGEDDVERHAPEYLQEDDPEALFGMDEVTAPPVIGLQPDESPGTG